MKKSQDQPADAPGAVVATGPRAPELRRPAEQRLKRQMPAGGGRKTEVDTARIAHELQVHQVQLEMQNEELQQAHAHVEALLAQYADLYDFAPTGYMTLDRVGAIRQTNLNGARLLGIERSQLVNRRFGLFVAEGDRRAFSEFLESVFASDARECCEVALPREGVQPLVVRMEGTRSADAQECRAIVLDVTEHKRAEENTRGLLAEVSESRRVLLSVIEDQKESEAERERLLARVETSRGALLSVVEDQRRAEVALSQLNARLEQRVLDRTAELLAANQELDSFAYAVSHDLRAPLRAMSGFSQAMLEDYRERLPDEARGFLDQIGQASQNMGRLIDGLLALSRSVRGGLQCDRVDLSALARRLCQELARAEPTRMVRWDVEDGLTAWGDPRMLEVVLSNLLGNAWKYTAGRATPSVRVYAEREAERVWHCVADNGAGFDMRHADRLFKPFQRLHRQDEFPGIGIGLATVQRVVHRHGGALTATAAVGQGATFRFHLPSAAAHMTEAS